MSLLVYFRPNLLMLENDKTNYGEMYQSAESEYDLFISSPMTSLLEDEYESFQKYINEEIIETLEETKRFHKIYYAGRKFENLYQVDPSSISVKKDLEALRTSKYYVLIHQKTVNSSVLIEAGYALALRKQSFYFVQEISHLPYMLREAPQSYTNVKIYIYSSKDHLKTLIERYLHPTL